LVQTVEVGPSGAWEPVLRGGARRRNREVEARTRQALNW